MNGLRNGDSTIQRLVADIKIDDIRPLHLSQRKFLGLQDVLIHHKIFRKSPTCCSFLDALPEFLRIIPMAVVSDTQTSWSRTCWLAASINDIPILVVLDSSQKQNVTYLTCDVWSGIESIDLAFQNRLGESLFGEMGYSFDHLKVEWDIEMKTETISQIIVTLSSDLAPETHTHDLYLCASYSDHTTEDFLLQVPLTDNEVSISIETESSEDTLSVKLDDIFFSIHVSDALWKPLSKKHTLPITWRNIIVTQVTRQLQKGKRFSNYIELQESLGLGFIEDENMIQRLFLDLSLENTPESCGHQRLDDYCKRSTLLSWLVTCFNPLRGLSGYIEMVTSPGVYNDIKELGTQRTWMEHISELANIAKDFTPTPIKLLSSKRSKKRGRPPTQLIPGPPLVDLFKKLITKPATYVCGNCRFKH